MLTRLISLPYEIARLPLAVVDSTLAGRLPETSAPRVALDRTIGSADRIAGAVLHNSVLARRGTERLERSAKLLTAEQLESEAAERRAEAQRTAAAGAQEAERARRAAEERAESGLEEADATEARRKQEAATRAAQAAATKKAAADERAARRAATAEQRKQAAEEVAEAEKRSAQREVRSEIDEASAAKKAALQARQDADRLDDLVDAKRDERTQD
ncbi:hypothetical protein QWY28_07150 [Nocardioides sp. SOB77]|uniref:IF2 family translation initiation factor n=1 Tax=Nocardioides oceani TaxID=3058369 RepID=A0ABT8FE65_9ACTN|nr:hypothetical protein [Nocardioides oceani]MDN4172710.1 hypothetical protein [Nocardioides oceani]